MPTRTLTPLVVNADDFGYFDGVSRGILAAIDAGAVTATGVMANGPALRRHVRALRDRTEVDTGVHLNLTLGDPLTRALGGVLVGRPGGLPRPAALARAVLTGGLRVAEVKGELRAQIDRCLDAGLPVRFLNSHEHVHMLPGLYSAVRALAAEYGVRFVRFVRPEWGGSLGVGAGGVARALLLGFLALLHPGRRPGPRLIGTGPSGRLSLAYLQHRLRRLAPGEAWELMCHPGYRDASDHPNPWLASFHRWEEELALLTGAPFAELCAELGVARVRFRDLALDSDDGRGAP
jgi:hypothetical protein